jgi:hypothetical protein
MDQNLSKLTKVGNWIATLLLGNTRELIIRIDERLSGFIVEMTEFKVETKAELKEIGSVLKGQGERLAVHTTMLSSHTEAIVGIKTNTMYQVRNSPTAPSEKGKKLLKDSGFDEVYPIIRQKIFKRMESNRLRTLYDYEKEAEFAIGSFRNDPIMDRVKDYVVNHEDEPLTLIFQIASWIVRDDYLKEHPLPPRQC